MTMVENSELPVCLIFAGHDPSGGAGLQADIEAVISMGAQALTVPTATTIQDTVKVHTVEAMPADLFIQQARTLLDDIPVSAIKIGLIPDTEIADAIHTILRDHPEIPVVLDPVLRAGSGLAMQDGEAQEVIRALLFPLVTVLTPNSLEARQLASNADTLDACGMSLLESGCDYVLITGGHENGEQVVNKLYGNHRCLDQFRWQRLEGVFHGTGCTLASGIAGLLAHGHEPHSAIREAQQYTWEAIKHARRLGRGQLIPNRLYWADRG